MAKMPSSRSVLRVYAIQRMFQRQIGENDVRSPRLAREVAHYSALINRLQHNKQGETHDTVGK
jgi:hypothetical protein